MATALDWDRSRSPAKKRPAPNTPPTSPTVVNKKRPSTTTLPPTSPLAVAHLQERSISDLPIVLVDPSRDQGVWEGWGVSLCWWAAMCWEKPESDAIADWLFTMKDSIEFQTTRFGKYKLPGLGMNIARYNAGASGPGMKPTKMFKTRTMDGFWIDRDEWDFSCDRQQVEMLRKAKERGANIFEIFSNSPMWWMCHTKNPSGSLSGTKDNLQPSYYKDFAQYLLKIVAHAQAEWDIDFEYVAPFNEPSSIWWNTSNNQEGCHFEHLAQASLVKVLKDVIKEETERAENESLKALLSKLKIAASDENTYDQAIDTWDSLDAGARETIAKINVHGYQKGYGLRHELHERAFSSMKPVWNSEYGDQDETGLSLANNLNLDFYYLHPTAWAYWQALDSGGWGLVQANPEDRWVGKPNAKLFVLAHYSRHIRPGMRILHLDAHPPRCSSIAAEVESMPTYPSSANHLPNSVAAYSVEDQKLVLVTTNQDKMRKIKYDLSRFHTTGGSAQVRWWYTDIDVAHVTCGKAMEKPTAYREGPQFDLNYDPAKDFLLEVWFDANTIQTFEITGIVPRPNPPPSRFTRSRARHSRARAAAQDVAPTHAAQDAGAQDKENRL